MDVFTTKAGQVRGRRSERDPEIVAVLGVPYAAPPFGARDTGVSRDLWDAAGLPLLSP